jgi:hypothetical protein
MGHPSSRNFENDFETLLKGEKIVGPGTEAAGESGPKEGGAASSEVSAEQI